MVKWFWLSLLVFLLPPSISNANVVPCVTKSETGWRLSLTESCRQLTIKQVQDNNKRLLLLRYYQDKEKKDLEALKLRETEVSQLKKDNQNISSQLKKTKEWLEGEATAHKKWRKAFEDLKKEKLPPKHWTQSPGLWFGIGFVSAGIVAGVVVGVVVAVRP